MLNSQSIFWKIIVPLLGIPFLLFVHYKKNVYSIESLRNQDPYISLGLLVLTILLWIILLSYLFKNWIGTMFTTKNNLTKIKNNGIKREAKILKAEKIFESNSFLNYQLELAFNNLSNAAVKHKIDAVETRPNENRFEIGKDITVLIDKDMLNPPYCTLANDKTHLNTKFLSIKMFFFLIPVTAIVFFYIDSYQTESNGMGWRFLSYNHSLLLYPVRLFVFLFFVQTIMKIIGLDKKTQNDDIVLKFKGIKTTAKILKNYQISPYKYQPRIAFEIEFTDVKNQIHQTTIKKYVDIIEINKMSKEEIEIIYLPENPTIVAFADEY